MSQNMDAAGMSLRAGATRGKPILCLDYDGVCTTYASGWQGIEVCADPPTVGFEAFLEEALQHFEVHIYSSRSGEQRGREAMARWFDQWIRQDLREQVHFPAQKPPAMLTIDDRAIQFSGVWHDVDVSTLRQFRPWTQHSAPPHESST